MFSSSYCIELITNFNSLITKYSPLDPDPKQLPAVQDQCLKNNDRFLNSHT